MYMHKGLNMYICMCIHIDMYIYMSVYISTCTHTQVCRMCGQMSGCCGFHRDQCGFGAETLGFRVWGLSLAQTSSCKPKQQQAEATNPKIKAAA